MHDATLDIRPTAGGYLLEQRQTLPLPRAKLFPFFSDPYNLESITPASLRFEVQEAAPMPLREGTTIRYRLRLHGIPMAWQSRITSWAPPHHFRDIQERGPYAMWDHLHLFVDKGQETVCVDRVHYALPGGVIGRLAHGLLVARDLRSIFAHRARVLSERFGAPRSWS